LFGYSDLMVFISRNILKAIQYLLFYTGEMLPEHVGIPVGEQHNGATYFMLEMHYDNPERKTCEC
jgi:hypothetical protein